MRLLLPMATALVSFVFVERELGTLPLAVGSFWLEKLFGVSSVDNYGSLVTLSCDCLKNSNAVSLVFFEIEWTFLTLTAGCLWLDKLFGVSGLSHLWSHW